MDLVVRAIVDDRVPDVVAVLDGATEAERARLAAAIDSGTSSWATTELLRGTSDSAARLAAQLGTVPSPRAAALAVGMGRGSWEHEDWLLPVLGQRPDGWLERFAVALFAADDWLDKRPRWRLLRAMVRAGMVAEPTDPRYVSWLFEAVRGPLDQAAQADPGLVPLLWRAFSTEEAGAALTGGGGPGGGGPRRDEHWAGLLTALGTGDPGTRVRAIDASLRALGAGLPDRDAAGFLALHGRLGVTASERRDRQYAYLRLLAAHPLVTVTFAQQVLGELLADGRLDARALVDASADVLVRADRKSVVAHLALLARILASDPALAPAIAVVVAPTLDPERADLALRTARLLHDCARHLDDDAREGVRAAITQALPAPWPELRATLGTLAPAALPTAPARPAVCPVPIDLPAPEAVTAIADVRELAEVFAHLLEEPAPALEIERALEAVVRLRAELPSSARALSKRARKVGESVVDEMDLNVRRRIADLVVRWLDDGPPSTQCRGYQLHGSAPDRASAPPGTAVREVPMHQNLGEGRLAALPSAWWWTAQEPAWTPSILAVARLHEVTVTLREGPALLLSTPTRGDWTIDPDEVLARLRTVAGAAGGRPHDRGTALLRIAPGDRAAVLSAGVLADDDDARLDLLAQRSPRWRRTVTPGLGGRFRSFAGHETLAWLDDSSTPGTVTDPVRGVLDLSSTVRQHGSYVDEATWEPQHEATLGLWAGLTPFDTDVLAAHAHPLLLSWDEKPTAGVGPLLDAIGAASAPLGAPSLSALGLAAGFRDATVRSRAAEAIARCASHGLLDGTALGAQAEVLVVEKRVKVNRLVSTLRDASGISDHAAHTVLAASARLLTIAPTTPGGGAIIELAAVLAESHRVRVPLPAAVAALAAGRAGTKSAMAARRLAALT
ncbi:DUF6493 family protein [Pengzhenrongella frigida]|uniref:Secreted protein n=1 Tax=Pengzhenrongella frigida TaxID=1259133 RepID=A0A4Q5N2B1_9MICO|nr:DUF6493 family protein [Cellulomonas sp. HLT2-17]RYV52312.1 hypothetical protein EUA98_03630 [Cellulomonas sp. HLT2-17]